MSDFKTLAPLDAHNLTALPIYHLLADGRHEHFAMIDVRDLVAFAVLHVSFFLF